MQALGSLPGSFPTKYRIELADVEGNNSVVNCSTVAENNNGIIILLEVNCIHDIQHRHFNITLTAINSVGESKSGPIPLSEFHTVICTTVAYLLKFIRVHLPRK